MLDFAQLVSEIGAMADARLSRAGAAGFALAEAARQIDALGAGWEELAARLEERAQWPWLVAIPREPMDLRRACPAVPECYAVVSSDGSQIAPDRHEVSSCYLLNISRIRLSYGDGERPLMASRPALYYEERDLAVQDGDLRLPLDGKYLAIRRMLAETEQLVDLLVESAREDRPCLGIADGTLIQWPISREAGGYSGQALDAFLKNLERARAVSTPIIGYISNPGGSSVVATLRAALCGEGFLAGARCSCVKDAAVPGRPPKSSPASCVLLDAVSDARLFSAYLRPGERSALFQSTSQVLTRYGDHVINFFYVNVGREAARVEIPKWAAENKAMLDLTHALVVDQAAKGRGYPVVLSEAHERAVVQAADRTLFYQLIEKAYLQRKLPAEFSLKSVSKRQPMV